MLKQQARGKVLDDWTDDQLEKHEEELVELDISHAAVQQIRQDMYKEVHSNEIAKQYRRFHTEREEDEGHLVTEHVEKKEDWSEEEKLKRLDEEVGEKWK